MSAVGNLLTDEQQRAIETRKVSVSLAAGAGCGKTFVLTERFLSHLRPDQPDGLDPDALHELVAITFTDAAAREMRSRIRKKCLERLHGAETEKDADWWLRLMRALETARVSTIHAFSTALLREHAVEARLDPQFEVLDQGAADVVLSETIDDVLRERLTSLDDEAIELAATFNLGRLKELIRDMAPAIRHGDEVKRWLAADADELLEVWQDQFAKEYPKLVKLRLANAPQVLKLQSLLAEFGASKKKAFQEAADELVELLPKLEAIDKEKGPHVVLHRIREAAKVQGICSAKDWPTKEQFVEYKDACAELRGLIDKLPGEFDVEAARPIAEMGMALLRLSNQVAEQYEWNKLTRNRLDFDDQLHLACKLLQDDAVRQKLSSELRLVLVDEFQDTDPVQVEIVEALCGQALESGRLFFVGDHKQSIYRFRGAVPGEFFKLRSRIKEEGQLPLTTNFRSQPAILNFVNALFRDAFEDYQSLQPQRKQVAKEPIVEFLWTLAPDKNNKQISGALHQARRAEAHRIARRIKTLLEKGDPFVQDRGEASVPRPLRLGDIAILFRALSDVRYYEEALRELRLEYYLVGGHAFYAQQEILDVLNLLKAVASSADEIALAGVLRSPFFSLADETLFWMMQSAGSLNRALEKTPPQHRDGNLSSLSDEELRKWRFAAETLSYLRSIKDIVPVATLLNEAVARTGFDASLCAEFLGQRKLANLHKLIEQARTADQGSVIDLDDFIVQLSEFTLRQPKEALAATSPETANVIRLMTIHYAKGLEFPLVIIPDLDRKERPSTDAAVFDPNLGPLAKLPETKITCGLDLYRAREATEEAEERTRLLYVACTRAADYLILSSSIARVDELQSDWMKLLAERFDLMTGEIRAKLPSEYGAPKVAVPIAELDEAWSRESQSRRPDLLKLVELAEQLAAEGGGAIPEHVGPVPIDRSAERRFSFTDLTGALVEDEAIDDQVLVSLHAKGSDPRELGRLVHALLERNGHVSDNELENWCEDLALAEVLFDPQAAAQTAAEMVRRFRGSQRARDLAQAKQVLRETEFLLAWPPDGGNCGRYFRGFIDCLFEDAAGRWHVVDYKTNNIRADDREAAVQQYRLQMVVYALAAEAALKQPPADLVVCFLRPGIEVIMPWNDSVRAEAIELVNQAIENFVGK